jgi:formyltetrahydrofolate synthetase
LVFSQLWPLNRFVDDSWRNSENNSFCEENGTEPASLHITTMEAEVLWIWRGSLRSIEVNQGKKLYFLYNPEQPLEEKLQAVVCRLYGADGVGLTEMLFRSGIIEEKQEWTSSLYA